MQPQHWKGCPTAYESALECELPVYLVKCGMVAFEGGQLQKRPQQAYGIKAQWHQEAK
jgi:hypothetical protein